jgi:hypothetical protein
MNITTKYSKGDKIFFIHDNRIYHTTIDACYVSLNKDGQKEEYSVSDKTAQGNYLPQGIPYKFAAEKLFVTKEELIAAIS